MQRLVDRAVVLGRVNFAEADRIVTVLTEHAGKISLIAKGSRKPKSKLAGGLELFNINEITYIPGKKDISTLVSSRLITASRNIVRDYDTSEQAFRVLKWLHTHLENGTGIEYYSLLADYILLADQMGKRAGIWMYMRILEFSGHGLNPFHDSQGDKLQAHSSYDFDFESLTFYGIEEGSFVVEDIKLLRLALTLDAPDFARVKITSAQADKLLKVFSQVMSIHF